MKKSFLDIEDELKLKTSIQVEYSGTTASMVILDSEKLVSINCGDSRAILVSCEDGKNVVTQLTRDHKPELPDETDRILKMNGRIEP